MARCRISAFLLTLSLLAAPALARSQNNDSSQSAAAPAAKPAPTEASRALKDKTLPHMSRQSRIEVIRDFDAQLVYIRTMFPMGTKGLKLKDGVTTPNGPELQQALVVWGPAAKPGDPARISDVSIKSDHIRFEINGGPIHKTKWYQRITITGASGASVTPSDPQANARGSFVDLYFDHYVPELSPQQLRELLRPVFDFEAKSKEQAYLETLPPKVREAIKNHQVLVGMNHEMVVAAKGRPPKKDREKDGDKEYEEWIFGDPPQDVDFVRFMGDEVVRVETMKVGGEKIVRTEKEVDIEPAVAAKQGQPEERPATAPTLRRPGEEPEAPPQPTGAPAPLPPPTSPPIQAPPGDPGPG